MAQPPSQGEERYFKMIAWFKGEHMNKKTRWNKTHHMHLQLQSVPPYNEIIRWIKLYVTSAMD
jgi:hypothetical protein